MVVFEMTVENLDKYEEALSQFPKVAAGDLEAQIKYAVRKMKVALQLYPPVPPGSTYKRTFKLRDGWLETDFNFQHLSGFDFDFQMENKAPYAGFVQGGPEDDPHQTHVHARNGWKTTDQVAAQFDSELGKEVEKLLDVAYADVFGRG